MVLVIIVFDGRGPTAYGKAARDICGGGRARHTHWAARAATDRGTNGDGGRNGAVRGIKTSLNEVFTLGLSNKGLEFRGGESVDEAGLGDDQKEDLCAGEGG